MGLIKATTSAVGGAFADTWREYFYAESLDKDILIEKGEKKIGGRSSNTKGNDNIISNGSIISIADGQCMIIVDQGKVIEICAEPGEFIYDASTEPSIFYGGLGDAISKTFSQIGKRITFGGDTGTDQRVYYINTKEIVGNKYGSPNGIPFRIVDNSIGLDMDMEIHCFGEYSYKITNPILFYTNVCGNVTASYNRTNIDSQLKSELLTALAPAFGKVSAMGVRYSEITLHTNDIANALNEELSAKWRDLRGIEIVAFGVSSATLSDDDEKMIKDMQQAKVLSNVNLAAGYSVAGQREAMTAAAKNEGGNGAMGAFMAMNMAGANNQAGKLFELGKDEQPSVVPNSEWRCACGQSNSGNFCQNCGKPKPTPEWTCDCGQLNSGKFCQNCGKPRQ